MPKRTINQGHHAIGEVVLVEKLGTVNLTLEERIEAENRGPAVSGKDGGSGTAKGLECHGSSSNAIERKLVEEGKQKRTTGYEVSASTLGFEVSSHAEPLAHVMADRVWMIAISTNCIKNKQSQKLHLFLQGDVCSSFRPHMDGQDTDGGSPEVHPSMRDMHRLHQGIPFAIHPLA